MSSYTNFQQCLVNGYYQTTKKKANESGMSNGRMRNHVYFGLINHSPSLKQMPGESGKHLNGGKKSSGMGYTSQKNISFFAYYYSATFPETTKKIFYKILRLTQLCDSLRENNSFKIFLTHCSFA